MAILTKNEKYIVDMYVRYFGKAPSKAEIAKYNDFKTPKLILDEIIGDADDSKATLTTKEFVNNAFQNLFGRNATTKEMNKYSKVVDAGEDLPINAIVKSAKKSDKGVYEAKQAIAIMLAEKDNATIYNNLDKITKDTYAKVYDLKTKKLLVDSVAQLETKIDAMKDNVTGQTFMLTTSADAGAAFTGTEKGDVFNAYDIETFTGAKNSLTGIDTLNGGEGLDTLNVKSDIAIGNITATISGIETINLESSLGIDSIVSGSNITGLNTLNVTKATTAAVDAASTTDVNVSGATGAINVSGGKNIVVNDSTADKAIVIGETAVVDGGSITETNAAGTITVTDSKQGIAAITTNGGTDVTINTTITTANAAVNGGDISVGVATAATGNVKITQNLNSDGGKLDTDDLTAANIVVNGGKTVDITVNATVTAKDKNAEGDITVGTIGVTGDGKTTDVTVKQNTTATTFVTAAVPVVKESTTITFKAMTAGQTLTVTAGNSLTFTALKDLTPEEVAAAFANLIASDRQEDGGKVANGTYTGQFSAEYTTSAVSGATVVFTGVDEAVTDITFGGTATAPTQVKVDGTIATAEGKTTNTVTKGAVSVVDTATTDAIKTVTIDGFNNALIGVDATATAVSQLDALTTLTLSNNTKDDVIEVGTASKTLTLNVDNITSTGTTYINLDHDGKAIATNKNNATIETLTINATGKDSSFELIAGALKDLTINATAGLDISDTSASYATTNLKTVDVNGAGKVNLGDISSATALNSFDASGNTGGVTAGIETEIGVLTGTITEYVFSAGNDVVTLLNDVIETKITLGAGDDKITLASGTGIADVVATIDGGTGSNTIDMTAADAEILSNNDQTFEGKISNFSKLSLGVVANDDDNTVDLANIDDISYVISAGTFDTEQVVDTTITLTVQLDVANTDDVSIDVDGITFTASNLAKGADLAADAATIATALATQINLGTTHTAAAAGAVLTITDVASGKVMTINNFTITGTGVGTIANVIASSELFLTNMANNGTLELTDAGMGATVTMKDASGSTDTFNIVTGDEAGNVGTVVVNSVETINVTTTDIFTDDGVKGGTKNDGKDDSNSSSELVVSADAAKTVNVSGAGDLTLDTTSVVLTKVDASKMTGDLGYTADGATAGTTVIAGSGDDTLTASGENDVLKGNAGSDTFYAKYLTTVYGGAGADKFYFATPTQLSKVSTIADLGSGDTIYLVDNQDADGASVVGKFFAAGAQYNANTTTTFEAKVNASLVQTGSSEATWFQHAGNTYIVIDNDTDLAAGGDTDPLAGAVDTYTAGKDVVIEITGLVNLSTASFNATTGTLEIA